MRCRGSLRRTVAALIAAGFVLSTASIVTADSVGDQKARVEQYAAQLDDLENRIGQLGEDYAAAEDKKAQLDQEIAESEARIAQEQARLDELSSVLGDIAVDKYVTGSALELSPLFSNAQAYTEAEQKDAFSRLALDTGSGNTDDVLAIAEDLAREQASLTRKQKQVADLVDTLNQKMAEAQTLQTEFEQKLSTAQAELGDLIEQERERRAEAAAAAELQRRKDEAAAASAPQSNATSTPRGGGTATPASSTTPSNPDPAPSGGSGGGATAPPDPAPSAPPVSSRAGTAVNAAMSQLGVPYRFAAESPGVAFDCSGLTKWAWGQAGVYLPHQSGAQYGSIPHVSQSDIQPGDLLFYKSPIGHVGMYIGGGSMVHATHPGDVVKVAVVNWAAVVGIGRPG
ncbi:MAG TPA: NlpC/P60 family protein [Ilumatobacteraceae bacterium]|jgi:cell wall-associated NlpC family hydrolase